jgi:hypothetical protein
MKGVNLYLMQDLGLTLPEASFLATYAETFSFAEAYLAFNPITDNAHDDKWLNNIGARTHANIRKKIGGKYNQYLESVGLGIDRIAREIENGLNATDQMIEPSSGDLKCVPNHNIRIKALSLLVDIQGLKTKKIKIENTQLENLMKKFDEYMGETIGGNQE